MSDASLFASLAFVYVVQKAFAEHPCSRLCHSRRRRIAPAVSGPKRFALRNRKVFSSCRLGWHTKQVAPPCESNECSSNVSVNSQPGMRGQGAVHASTSVGQHWAQKLCPTIVCCKNVCDQCRRRGNVLSCAFVPPPNPLGFPEEAASCTSHHAKEQHVMTLARCLGASVRMSCSAGLHECVTPHTALHVSRLRNSFRSEYPTRPPLHFPEPF